MSLLLLNTSNAPNVVIQKSLFSSGTEAVKNREVRWWSQRGIIYYSTFDKDGKEITRTMPVQKFRTHLYYLASAVSNSKDDVMFADEIKQTKKFIREACELVKKAIREGDPHDIRVFEDKIKHSGEKVSVSMASINNKPQVGRVLSDPKPKFQLPSHLR